MQMPNVLRSVAPSVLPVTLAEAKKHLEISPSDTTHDDQITMLIEVATNQFENDTDLALLTQTFTHETIMIADEYIQLTKRPVQSITSIEFYNTANVLETMGTEIYNLNKARRRVQLAYDQIWPSVTMRWDAIKVTYVAGFGDTSATVPATCKHAILLLIGHYFENRDMLVADSMSNMPAYERLVRQHVRSSYP